MAELIKDHTSVRVLDSRGRRVIVTATLEITDDLRRAEHDLLVRYGRDADGILVVQLEKEVIYDHPEVSVTVPFDAFSPGEKLPTEIIKFLNTGKFDPEEVAWLVRESAHHGGYTP